MNHNRHNDGIGTEEGQGVGKGIKMVDMNIYVSSALVLHAISLAQRSYLGYNGLLLSRVLIGFRSFVKM